MFLVLLDPSSALLLLSWFMLYSDTTTAIKYESLCFSTKPPAGLKNGLAAYLTSCDPAELYTTSLKRRTPNTRALHLHTKAHSYAFTAWKQLLVTIWRYNKPERVICFSNTTESITVLRLLSLSHIRSCLNGLLEAGADSDGCLRCYLGQNELGKMYYPKQNL